MKFANATNLNRKSGVAQWRDLRFHSFPTQTRKKYALETGRSPPQAVRRRGKQSA